MSATICLIVLYFAIKLANSFNLDTKFPIIYTDPYEYNNISSTDNKSSYFGYSLVLYPGDGFNPEPWIGIGAPRGDSPNLPFKNPGVVFQCGIPGKCELIPHDANIETKNYILDDAFIGGTMDINLKYRIFVTCGYHEVLHDQVQREYYTLGACYWSHINNNSSIIEYHKLEPLNQNYRYILSHPRLYNYGHGEAGFSVHLTPDEREIVIGAPGLLNWIGSTILYSDADDDGGIIANRLRGLPPRRQSRQSRKEPFQKLNIAKPTLSYRSNSFFGYSTTSGHFYQPNKTLWYASGVPRGIFQSGNYLGIIYVYRFNQNTDQPVLMSEERTGSQFGDYFGASLTAGDINSDGYDDLIVGAPYYKSKEFNEGRIYVFYGSSKRFQDEPQEIDGTFKNGQFGSTVQFLGDLDGDGFGDVAVAAPWEESSGAVYIFKGNAEGLLAEPSQRILGKDISKDIRGFGVAISRATDIDSNFYADIAIGAYKSGHAVILRSKPTVRILHQLNSLSERLLTKQDELIITACYTSVMDRNYSMNVNISRTINVDDQFENRASLVGPNTRTISLSDHGSWTCENVSIKIGNKFANRQDPLTISLSHNLLTAETDGLQEDGQAILVGDKVTGNDLFCKSCPIYDRYRSDKPTRKSIPFFLGCGSDNICNPILEVTAAFPNLRNNTFIYDSPFNVILETNVSNSGEKAYFTQISVVLPELMNFAQIPPNCEELNSSAIRCDVDNPLEENTTKTVLLLLDMDRVNERESIDPLDILITVHTSSEYNDNTPTILIMNFKREADITISGKSNQQSYSYSFENKQTSNDSSMSNAKVDFAQTFQVQKSGISAIGEVVVEIEIPYALTSNSKLLKFLSLIPRGSLTGKSITCFSSTNLTDQISENSPSSDDDMENLMNSYVPGENNGKLLKRSIPQVEVFNESSPIVKNKADILDASYDFDSLANRTFYINCSTPEISCAKIECRAGPIKLAKDIAVIDLGMAINLAVIKDILKSHKKDVISFASHASVFVPHIKNFHQSGSKPDEVTVISVFLGEVIKKKVDIWIIVVAVVAGILILGLLILGLIKAGFFKRSQKEKLDNLKKELIDDEDNNGTADEEGTEEETEAGTENACEEFSLKDEMENK